MDLKGYYRRIRELESSIEDEFPVVRSLATDDGGKAGQLTEVPRAVAAQMVNDGSAELADTQEAQQFRLRVAEAHQREERRRRAEQIQFTILSEADLRSVQAERRGSRKE
jgi:hypothetical protein